MAATFLAFTPDRLDQWYHPRAVARLRELGEVRLAERAHVLDTGQLTRAAAGCDVIIADRLVPGERALFERLPGLLAFVRCAMDVENIDVEAASRHGVLVTRASPGWIDAVAELVIGSMIALARRIPDSVSTYRSGRVPEPVIGRQLAGTTLTVIGYGNIGRRVAELGLALRMRVVVFDPHVSQVGAGMEQLTLEDALAAGDFVVCLAASSPATERLMDAGAFAKMRPSTFFINASRGRLVDEGALELALRESRLAGAALDVGSAPGDLPAEPLAKLPNVIATPHIGGFVPEAIAHQALETAEQVKDILSGTAPSGALNLVHWRRQRASRDHR